MDNEIKQQIIYGKNAVSEALNSEKEIDTIFIQRGASVGNIICAARTSLHW